MKKNLTLNILVLSVLVLGMFEMVSALTIVVTNPVDFGSYEGTIPVTWTVAPPFGGTVGFNGYYMNGYDCTNANFILHGMPAFSDVTYSMQPINWNINSLPDSTQYCFRIISNEGADDHDDVGWFTIDNTAPTADLSVSDHGDEYGNPTDVSFSYSDAIGVTYCNLDWGDGNSEDCLGDSSSDHQYDGTGPYTITLTVRDGIGHETTETATANPEAVIPTAEANGPYTCDEGGSVLLDSTGSTDTYGISSYEWKVDDVVVSTNPTYLYNCLDGAYLHNVVLTVVNNAGNSNSDTSTITESNLNPWNVDAHGPYFANEGSSVLFTGSAEDVPADAVSYHWNFGDGGTSTEQNPSHTYMNDGIYPVTLTASDEDGGSFVVETTATISDLEPTAHFTFTPASPNEGSEVQFYEDCSSYPDDIVSGSWTFGDEGTSTEENPSHTYVQNGVYTVTIYCVDEDGDTASYSEDITVNNVAPVVSVEPDQTINENTLATINVHFDEAGNDDWHFGDVNWGDGITEPLTITSRDFSLTHTYADEGSYTATVTISDGDGGVGSDSAIITVNNVAPILINLPASASGVMYNAFSFDVDATDVPADTLTYSLVSAPAGMTIDSSTGLISWTPGLGQDGDHFVNVMVSDGDGGTDSEVLNLHIYDFVLDLDEGWNLISFPLIPTDTNVENVFDSVKENLNKIWVYKYDENTGKNVWYYKTYNEDWEGSEEFVDVEPGFGYFVEMSNYDSVSFDGSKMSGFGIPPSQTVVPGWNLIGHYGMKTDVSKSNAFTDSLSSYYSTMLDDEGNPQDSLNPTNGYWLFITETSNRLYAPSAFSYAY